MEKITFTMHADRETKRTFRFEEEVETGGSPVIGILYVKKPTFSGMAPTRIQVTIEDAPED